MTVDTTSKSPVQAHSNRLPVLAAEINDAHDKAICNAGAAVENAFKAGELLRRQGDSRRTANGGRGSAKTSHSASAPPKPTCGWRNAARTKYAAVLRISAFGWQ